VEYLDRETDDETLPMSSSHF